MMLQNYRAKQTTLTKKEYVIRNALYLQEEKLKYLEEQLDDIEDVDHAENELRNKLGLSPNQRNKKRSNSHV